MKGGEIASIIILAALVFMAGFGYGFGAALSDQRGQAVKAGVGRYTVNPATGETTFTYGAPAAAVRR